MVSRLFNTDFHLCTWGNFFNSEQMAFVQTVFAKIPLFMQIFDWPWLLLSALQDNAHFPPYYIIAGVDLRQAVCNTGVPMHCC